MSIETTLTHQNTIALYKDLPKKYKPNLLTVVSGDSELNQEFLSSYDSIFFKHLQKVITHNNIQLEATCSKLSDIVPQVQKHLATLSLPAHQTTKLYEDFLKQCQLTKDTPVIRPELHRIISKKPTDLAHSKQSKRPTTGNKPASKKQKLSPPLDQVSIMPSPPLSPAPKATPDNHFLFLGPQASSTPS